MSFTFLWSKDVHLFGVSISNDVHVIVVKSKRKFTGTRLVMLNTVHYIYVISFTSHLLQKRLNALNSKFM
jgi:hypothetical protein